MKTINGAKLKQMIISGTNNLYNHYPEIDALNVFPVPDGDTGTNMNLTMASGAKEIQNRNDEDIFAIAKSFSRGLLMGARGNSGVILSQIFRGFAQALEGKASIGVQELSDAFMNGKDVAYKAVMRPVEGTILTVIREAATALHDNVSEISSIERAFEVLIGEAYASLERTPDLLPVLKQVGVVDSGAAGLIKILEGFQSALKGKIIEKQTASAFEESSDLNKVSQELLYCTEFILRLANEEETDKKSFLESRFLSWLNTHGNSVVLSHEENLVKVHIHSLKPGEILNFAQQYGEFLKVKVENITEQHTKLIDDNQEKTINNKQEEKEYAIIAVAVGDGIEKMFKELRVDYIVSGGQTMNPATEDFVKAIKECNAKNIFILPNNSNIILSASQAADVCGEKVVKVIPSKSIPQGLVACMMFNPEATVDENYKEMLDALENVITGQVTFAVKDTVISGIEIKKGQFMGMRNNKEIVCCYEDKFSAARELIESMLDEMSSIVTIIYGEDVSEEAMNSFVDNLKVAHSDLDFDVRKGNQPVYSFIIGVE